MDGMTSILSRILATAVQFCSLLQNHGSCNLHRNLGHKDCHSQIRLRNSDSSESRFSIEGFLRALNVHIILNYLEEGFINIQDIFYNMLINISQLHTSQEAM